MSIQAFILSSMKVFNCNYIGIGMNSQFKNAIEQSSAVFVFDVSYFAAGPKAHDVYNKLMFTQ